MLRKQASIVEGEYKEWEKNEGIMHPSTQAQKSRGYQSEFTPISIGRTESRYSMAMVRTRGFRIA